MTGQLVLEHVEKRRGPRTVIHDVSLTIDAGRSVGLLGANGTGKSTLLQLMSGLLKPDRGRISIDGQPVGKQETSRVIGFVSQDIALYESLTALENLAFFGRIHGLTREKAAKRAETLLETVDLSDRRYERVLTLSGGMQRRVHLAAAMMHQPRILLLDEPTTGIDSRHRESIHRFLRHQHEIGTTIVMTSHLSNDVEAVCEHVLTMANGKLDEIIRPNDRLLLNNGHYSTIEGLPS